MTVTQSQAERGGELVGKEKSRLLIRRFAQTAVYLTRREAGVRQRAQGSLYRQPEARGLRDLSQLALADADDATLSIGFRHSWVACMK